jgi:phage-related protein
MSYSVVLLKKAVEFIDELEPKLAAKAIREIELLKDIGPELSFPHTRKIEGTEKLYELRVKQGTNICRLFYFSKGRMIFIITSGYIKKTNKTDKDEIKRAVRLMNEYLGGE